MYVEQLRAVLLLFTVYTSPTKKGTETTEKIPRDCQKGTRECSVEHIDTRGIFGGHTDLTEV